MTETTIDKTYGDANCTWCEAPFTKTSANRLYCSTDCAREKKATAQVYVSKTEIAKVGSDYHDYEDHSGELIDKYGVKVPDVTREDRQGGERHAVPDLKFKQFKETRNVIVFTNKREVKREEWV